mgnify:CR=1 FL=1
MRVTNTGDWLIAERRASGEDRGDLLSMLLLAQDTEGDGEAIVRFGLRHAWIDVPAAARLSAGTLRSNQSAFFQTRPSMLPVASVSSSTRSQGSNWWVASAW